MDPELLVLPALIFLARIADTSLGTVRIVVLVTGRRVLPAFLGFIEVAIWVLATGGVVSNLDNPLTVIAFAGGFAVGTMLGLWIEERIALGYRVVQVINRDPAIYVAARLRELDYRVTRVDGHGLHGPVEIAILVIRRRRLHAVRALLEEIAPAAFVTIERADTPFSGTLPQESRFGRFPWRPLLPLGGVRK